MGARACTSAVRCPSRLRTGCYRLADDGRLSEFSVFVSARVGQVSVFCVSCKGEAIRLGRNPEMNQSIGDTGREVSGSQPKGWERGHARTRASTGARIQTRKSPALLAVRREPPWSFAHVTVDDRRAYACVRHSTHDINGEYEPAIRSRLFAPKSSRAQALSQNRQLKSQGEQRERTVALFSILACSGSMRARASGYCSPGHDRSLANLPSDIIIGERARWLDK